MASPSSGFHPAFSCLLFLLGHFLGRSSSPLPPPIGNTCVFHGPSPPPHTTGSALPLQMLSWASWSLEDLAWGPGPREAECWLLTGVCCKAPRSARKHSGPGIVQANIDAQSTCVGSGGAQFPGMGVTSWTVTRRVTGS